MYKFYLIFLMIFSVNVVQAKRPSTQSENIVSEVPTEKVLHMFEKFNTRNTVDSVECDSNGEVSTLAQVAEHAGNVECKLDKKDTTVYITDYQRVFDHCMKLAKQGDANAQNNLGVMYYDGKGTRRNNEEAARWFRKAAEQGHANAQYNVGVMYYDGKGTPQDYGEAIGWFRQAAEQGHAAAQYNVGVMYDNGKGVKEDVVEARKWYKEAAKQGYALARIKFGWRKVGLEFEPDDEEVIELSRQLAEQGDAKAQYRLGLIYDLGYGVERDEEKAVGLYRLAAEQGHDDAQFRLQWMNMSTWKQMMVSVFLGEAGIRRH